MPRLPRIEYAREIVGVVSWFLSVPIESFVIHCGYKEVNTGDHFALKRQFLFK